MLETENEIKNGILAKVLQAIKKYKMISQGETRKLINEKCRGSRRIWEKGFMTKSGRE